MKIHVKRLREEAVLPTRAHHDDAGMDIYACEKHIVPPHQTVKIGTGIAFEIPSGYALLVWDKSSLGSKGLKTLGGVLDASYRGELFICIHNMSDTSYTFEAGEKIAQALVQKVELCEIEEVTELSDTERGEGGFGSTGK